MMVYRFYRLAAGGCIATTGQVACATDASALVAVAKLLNPRETAEVWDGIRHVGRVGCTGRPITYVRESTG